MEIINQESYVSNIITSEIKGMEKKRLRMQRIKELRGIKLSDCDQLPIECYSVEPPTVREHGTGQDPPHHSKKYSTSQPKLTSI